MFRSFGKVTVAAAGTPQQVAARDDTNSTTRVQYVTVFALSGNSGANIYVGGPLMNKSTFVDVYAIVPKGTSIPLGVALASNGVEVSALYLDGDSNGDAALVSAVEQ